MVYSMKTITCSGSMSSSDVQASSKIKRGGDVRVTTRTFLIIMLLAITAGCGGGPEPSDAPFSAFEKSVEEYDVTEYAVPVFREVDGVTYINDILIVNREYGLPPDYNPGLEPAVIDAYTRLIQDAAAEGYSLTIVSGFRS